jgi:site-specific recombinase XerD
MVRITLSQAVDGFILDKQAERLSPRTLEDYLSSFRKFAAFLAADLPLDQITPDHVRRFMVELGSTPRAPGGVAPRPPRILSKKSQLNVHVALSSLWSWAVAQGLAARHVVRDVPRPRPEKRAVLPFSQADLRALLAACEHTGDYTRPGKAACHNTRPTALRDRAILLLLLDTGMRASELCGLSVADLDLKNRQARVFGKGDKERILHFSPATGRALWRYLTLAHPSAPSPNLGEGRGGGCYLLPVPASPPPSPFVQSLNSEP